MSMTSSFVHAWAKMKGVQLFTRHHPWDDDWLLQCTMDNAARFVKSRPIRPQYLSNMVSGLKWKHHLINNYLDTGYVVSKGEGIGNGSHSVEDISHFLGIIFRSATNGTRIWVNAIKLHLITCTLQRCTLHKAVGIALHRPQNPYSHAPGHLCCSSLTWAQRLSHAHSSTLCSLYTMLSCQQPSQWGMCTLVSHSMHVCVINAPCTPRSMGYLNWDWSKHP